MALNKGERMLQRSTTVTLAPAACDKTSFFKNTCLRLLALGATLFCGAVGAASGAQAQLNCQSLLSFSFPNTTITSAASSPGGAYCGTDAWHICFNNLPPSCQVTATIAPVSGSSIGVTVWMPTQRYNGRYLGTGNGGYAGGYFDSELAQGINYGFATANTDMGMGPCLSYGLNAQFCAEFPQSWIDFGWRSTYLMTQFSKALIKTFYGSAPNYSYFAGCSTGGQQALMEAQRFPNDYNGILAGDPANYRTHLHTVFVQQYDATHSTTTGQASAGYIPVPSGFDTVNATVLKQCVGHDGGAPTDRFLNNPRACMFNPAVLQCPNNASGPSCLTSAQVATFQQYYQGPVDPVTGASIYPGNAPGSEADSALGLGMAYNENLNEPEFDGLFYWVFGLNWQWQTFDFHNNVAQVDQVLGQDLNAINPDLSAFKNAGGKLIQYHGWADPVIPSIGSINYYNSVTQTMGGNLSNYAVRQTQNFYRLYMAPGMWHCGETLAGGPGPNSFGGVIQEPTPSYDPQHNLLSALTQWVEQGSPPGAVIATKFVQDTPTLGIQMQRPICVYPQVAQYNGTGDPTLPSSFDCPDKGNVANQGGANVASHDLNGDGYSDIVWRNTAGDVGIWLMNGSTVSQAPVLGNVSTNWSVIGQRQLNSSGYADVIWRNTAGDVGVWLMNGSQILSTSVLGNVPPIWSVVGTSAYNATIGYSELFWRDAAGDVGIWQMNGAQVLSAPVLGNVPLNWTIAGIGDFGGTSKADILWRDSAGDVAIWFMNGTQIVSTPVLGNVPTDWVIVGTGDFNGDGKSDILWRNSAGDIGVWFMNGSQIASASVLGNVPVSWSVAETGDFNGDGYSDILWRNSNGDVAIWLMNGTKVLAAPDIGNVLFSWTIQSANLD